MCPLHFSLIVSTPSSIFLRVVSCSCPTILIWSQSIPNANFVLFSPIFHLVHSSFFLHSLYSCVLRLPLTTSPHSCVLSFWCPICGMFRQCTGIPCTCRGCYILHKHSFHLGEFLLLQLSFSLYCLLY